jgi:hypothetical protein
MHCGTSLAAGLETVGSVLDRATSERDLKEVLQELAVSYSWTLWIWIVADSECQKSL